MMERAKAKVLGGQRAYANNAELRALRARLNLRRDDVAEVCRVSRALVDSWLYTEDSPNFRIMSSKELRLLKLETGLESPAYRHLRKDAAKFKAQIQGGA